VSPARLRQQRGERVGEQDDDRPKRSPRELAWPEEPLVGAESVHRIFRGWLAGLGHEGYAPTDVDSPGLSTRTSDSGATAAT
jgi:hypothetical protein